MTLASTCRDPAVGNLRQRALAAAHRMLEARGEAGLTLRAIAAELNTGVASLYYHFANKDALLAELAIDGFRELGRWMAMAAASPGARTTFNASGHAYLGFTRHRPALYAIMYDERLQAGHPGIRCAEAEAFDIYQSSLANLGLAEGDVADVTLAFWTLGRGIASISDRFSGGSPGAAKEIVARVIRGLETLTGAPIAALSVATHDAA
jgi:AcrR family transcriptional regulator